MSDLRSRIIHLASDLPKGDATRRKLLEAVSKTASGYYELEMRVPDWQEEEGDYRSVTILLERDPRDRDRWMGTIEFWGDDVPELPHRDAEVGGFFTLEDAAEDRHRTVMAWAQRHGAKVDSSDANFERWWRANGIREASDKQAASYLHGVEILDDSYGGTITQLGFSTTGRVNFFSDLMEMAKAHDKWLTDVYRKLRPWVKASPFGVLKFPGDYHFMGRDGVYTISYLESWDEDEGPTPEQLKELGIN